MKLIEAKDEASKKEAGMLKEITRVEAETEFCQGTLNGDQGQYFGQLRRGKKQQTVH